MNNQSLREWEQDNIKILTSRQMGEWLSCRDNRMLGQIHAEIEQILILYEKEEEKKEQLCNDMNEAYIPSDVCYGINLILEIIDKHMKGGKE